MSIPQFDNEGLDVKMNFDGQQTASPALNVQGFNASDANSINDATSIERKIEENEFTIKSLERELAKLEAEEERARSDMDARLASNRAKIGDTSFTTSMNNRQDNLYNIRHNEEMARIAAGVAEKEKADEAESNKKKLDAEDFKEAEARLNLLLKEINSIKTEYTNPAGKEKHNELDSQYDMLIKEVNKLRQKYGDRLEVDDRYYERPKFSDVSLNKFNNELSTYNEGEWDDAQLKDFLDRLYKFSDDNSGYDVSSVADKAKAKLTKQGVERKKAEEKQKAFDEMKNEYEAALDEASIAIAEFKAENPNEIEAEKFKKGKDFEFGGKTYRKDKFGRWIEKSVYDTLVKGGFYAKK